MAILFNNTFKTVQQGAKDQKYLPQYFTALPNCPDYIILWDCYNLSTFEVSYHPYLTISGTGTILNKISGRKSAGLHTAL